jgi:hypothetical protein
MGKFTVSRINVLKLFKLSPIKKKILPHHVNFMLKITILLNKHSFWMYIVILPLLNFFL